MPTTAVREHGDQRQCADGCDSYSDAELSSAASVSKSSAGASSVARSMAHLPGASSSSTKLPDEPKQAASQSHTTARPLRKSASVDSCIAQRSSAQSGGRTDGLLRADASTRLDGPGSSPPERTETRALSSPPSAMSLSSLLRSKVGRRRGVSNANTTDNDTSAQEDSDFDKSNVSSGTVKHRVRARLLSLKSSKTSGSGSEARDATRLPVRGTSASLSNLKVSNPSSSKLSPKSTTSSQDRDKTVLKETKRARSHSVGPPSRSTTSKLVKRLSFGNQTPRPEILREISIAVVGPTGCGKSTFVRKGLRKHNLSNPESLVATVTAGDMTRNVSYIRRTAHLLTEFNTDTTLRVCEYDSLDWKINGNGSLLSVWPSGLPHADGIFVCYDASDRASFIDVIQLASEYKAMGIPTLVIACKTDLEKRVPPEDAAIAIDPYSKLVEVSHHCDEGKRRMRKAVDRLVKQVVATQPPSRPRYASSTERQVVTSFDLPSQKSEITSALPLTVQTSIPLSPIDLASPVSPSAPLVGRLPLVQTKPALPSSLARRSPTRVHSMNDILSDHRRLLVVSSPYESDKENMKLKSVTSLSSSPTKSVESLVGITPPVRPTSTSSANAIEGASNGVDYSNCTDKEKYKTRALPTPWVTLEELLEKLFFLAISGDDPSFIAHFFLTYRRFATPRSVLLGMQKRMNELRQPTSDITLSCFAQMRICSLLEQWTRDYPSDFAVPGTHGALHAIVRHTLSHSHTLSYGSDFLPFIDVIGTLSDEDAAWALKADVSSITESDTEADNMFDAELGSLDAELASPASSFSPQPSRSSTSEPPSSPRSTARERRSSLPLSAMALIRTPILNAFYNLDDHSGPSTKEIISKLQRAASTLSNYEAETIANEITRRELELLLKIEPRDWLRHTFIPGKKDPNTDPLAKFNANYNDLHEWAVSLILCHEKPKGRARQIEKLAEVASKLRMLNNYSALRALITAINQATYPGDQAMEIFKTKVDLHKKFLSSDILLRTTGAHQSYRMALRNTKGPCIPSLEVHTSDLHRAHEGNADTKSDDPSKINWAKYNMMGRFIATTTSIQQRCTGPNGYKFMENRYLGQLLDVPVMDYELQQSRVAAPSDDDATFNISASSTSFIGSHSKEGSVIKRILQW